MRGRLLFITSTDSQGSNGGPTDPEQDVERHILLPKILAPQRNVVRPSPSRDANPTQGPNQVPNRRATRAPIHRANPSHRANPLRTKQTQGLAPNSLRPAN